MDNRERASRLSSDLSTDTAIIHSLSQPGDLRISKSAMPAPIPCQATIKVNTIPANDRPHEPTHKKPVHFRILDHISRIANANGSFMQTHKYVAAPAAFCGALGVLWLLQAAVTMSYSELRLLAMPPNQCSRPLKAFLVSIQAQPLAPDLCSMGYTLLEDVLHMTESHLLEDVGVTSRAARHRLLYSSSLLLSSRAAKSAADASAVSLPALFLICLFSLCALVIILTATLLAVSPAARNKAAVIVAVLSTEVWAYFQARARAAAAINSASKPSLASSSQAAHTNSEPSAALWQTPQSGVSTPTSLLVRTSAHLPTRRHANNVAFLEDGKEIEPTPRAVRSPAGAGQLAMQNLLQSRPQDGHKDAGLRRPSSSVASSSSVYKGRKRRRVAWLPVCFTPRSVTVVED